MPKGPMKKPTKQELLSIIARLFNKEPVSVERVEEILKSYKL